MKKIILSIGVAIFIIFLFLFGTYKLMNARTFQLFGGLTNQVETTQKVAALTFDDGPTKNVEQILPLLKKYNAKATFFLIGNEIEKSPEEAAMSQSTLPTVLDKLCMMANIHTRKRIEDLHAEIGKRGTRIQILQEEIAELEERILVSYEFSDICN